MTAEQSSQEPRQDDRPPQDAPATLFDIVGEDGFDRLVAAFYEQVRGDDILGPMYPEQDMQGAQDRLRDFLIFRFGGPQRYIEQRGHPRLRMRHFPFKINRIARDRWLQLMDNALERTQLDPQAEQILRGFFQQVADHMINHAD